MTHFVRPNIAASAGYVPGEQPTDTQTIKLNTNENPYPPSPKVMEAIRSVTPEQLRRYPSPAGQAFREAAGKTHNLPTDWFLTFNGGDEFLSVVIRAVASESDTVGFLEPSYSLYPVLTELNGSKVAKLSYDITPAAADGNPIWRLPANIERLAVKLLLIVNPNAPSGHLDALDTFRTIARRFSGVLVIDEAYVDFAPVSALSLVQEFPNVLLLRTMSKGYSLAGLRFGYAIGQPALLKQIEKVRDSYPVDAIAIAAATAAILDQSYAQSTWQKVIAERARVSAALRHMGFSLPNSASNFVLAQIPTKPGLTARQIYETLKSRGLLIRYWDLPQIADKIRITIGTPEQNERLLGELKTLI
jgi:histidinol-phosphate aminotransferase